YHVTGPKLLLLLKECVVNRPLRRRLCTTRELATPTRLHSIEIFAALDAAARGDSSVLERATSKIPYYQKVSVFGQDRDQEEKKSDGDADADADDDAGETSTEITSAFKCSKLSKQMLSANMIKLYVAVVVDLWQMQ
ncbi:hypothetical protein OC846_006523, partial [Tilletia horrida]